MDPHTGLTNFIAPRAESLQALASVGESGPLEGRLRHSNGTFRVIRPISSFPQGTQWIISLIRYFRNPKASDEAEFALQMTEHMNTDQQFSADLQSRLVKSLTDISNLTGVTQEQHNRLAACAERIRKAIPAPAPYSPPDVRQTPSPLSSVSASPPQTPSPPPLAPAQPERTEREITQARHEKLATLGYSETLPLAQNVVFVRYFNKVVEGRVTRKKLTGPVLFERYANPMLIEIIKDWPPTQQDPTVVSLYKKLRDNADEATFFVTLDQLVSHIQEITPSHA